MATLPGPSASFPRRQRCAAAGQGGGEWCGGLAVLGVSRFTGTGLKEAIFLCLPRNNAEWLPQGLPLPSAPTHSREGAQQGTHAQTMLFHGSHP